MTQLPAVVSVVLGVAPFLCHFYGRRESREEDYDEEVAERQRERERERSENPASPRLSSRHEVVAV